MANTTTEVKGFKNSELGEVMLKPAPHTHDRIKSGDAQSGCSVEVYIDEQSLGHGEPTLYIKIKDEYNNITKSAAIDLSNIDNLNRALATPSSTPEDADKLITSAAVHGALALKADSSHTHKIEDISKLPDITLLVLRLAAAADIEYLSWTTIDSNASYYSMTSLTVSNERAYTIGGVYKISDGTTTKYGQATSIDTEHHVVGFNEAFQGMSSSGITISKLS